MIRENEIKTVGSKRLGLRRWDSMQEFVDYCEQLTDKELQVGGSVSNDIISARQSREYWRFGQTFPDREATRQALSEGRISEKLREKLETLSYKLEQFIAERGGKIGISSQRKRRYNETDGEVNIDRYLAGTPELYETCKRDAKARSIRLGVNFAVSSGNEEDTFIKLAANIMVLSDMLNRLGYPTEIIATNAGHNVYKDKKKLFSEGGDSIIIKESNEPLDLQRLASVSAPGLFRYYSFASWLVQGECNWGMGQALESTPAMKEFLGVDYLVETKWTEGSDSQQVEKLDGIIHEIQS